MTDRIEFLTRNRDAISDYLNELRKCASPEARATNERH